MIVSEALWRVVDRSVQVLGGQGVTDETVVARIFADMRAFRIYDGPSEVHRWSIAKRILKGHDRAGLDVHAATVHLLKRLDLPTRTSMDVKCNS